MKRRGNSATVWEKTAARVGELLPPVQLHPRVLAWAARRPRSETWCVAFSGGADSLALLLLLKAHFPARPLVALHFNHRLRGRESDGDERFCRRVCTALGVRLRVGAWAAGRGLARTVGADLRPAVSEAGARAARHGFFNRAMKQLRTKALWLAHQQDDIAESMLMRLARGSGAAGLAAPRPVQIVGDGRIHLRPLLTLKKSELVAALRRARAKWREDATNLRGDFFRNRVRRRVVPTWLKAAGRDAVAGAALARELLEDDDTALEAWLDEIRPLDRHGRLHVRLLAGKPVALVRRALHRWLLSVRPATDLSRQGFAQMLAMVVRGRDSRFSLGREGFAVIRQGTLTFRKG